jgi:hypothetical protein
MRLGRQKGRILIRKRGRGTLQSKKAKPRTTITPTPAIIPVIVGSNVLPEPAFVSCASANVKRRASPIMEMHILRMMKNCPVLLQIMEKCDRIDEKSFNACSSCVLRL